MAYPELPPLKTLSEQIESYAQRQHEYGAPGIEALLLEAQTALETVRHKLATLPVDQQRSRLEPSELKAIRALRPDGKRRIWTKLQPEYEDRLTGAFLGRSAGCILGAGVELWPVERMKNLARENGGSFPPVNYWEYLPDPFALRYTMSPRFHYTRTGMHGIPVDDDIAYTLLGLLIVEEHGLDFTTSDIAQAWLKYLPLAYTAEEVTLANLRKGIPADKAGEIDNPYCEWIGADIRSDPWAYMAPGWPEQAAALAHRDAILSHRRQGVYGEMFFAAAISAAFALDDPVEALRQGLLEIPADCALAREVRWALEVAPSIRSHADARGAVDEKFKGMHQVHTINNACLTIWGITLGGTDFTRVISETVAMGLDNDCTAATAGSLVGAVVGKQGIPEHWYQPFGDHVESYLIGKPRFSISDVLKRFTVQASRFYEQARL